MAITKYFTESFIVYRKTRAKVDGVMKETSAEVDSRKGAIDKAVTAYGFIDFKETFVFTDVLFAPKDTDILEDDLVDLGGDEYDVVSVIDPMRRHNHKEILINRRK